VSCAAIYVIFLFIYFFLLNAATTTAAADTRWVLTKERVVLISERARGDTIRGRVRFARAAYAQPKSNFSTAAAAARATKLGGGKVHGVCSSCLSDGPRGDGERGNRGGACRLRSVRGWLTGRRARGPGGHHRRRRLARADGRTNCARVTDGRTDGRTDGWTDGRRRARRHGRRWGSIFVTWPPRGGRPQASTATPTPRRRAHACEAPSPPPRDLTHSVTVAVAVVVVVVVAAVAVAAVVSTATPQNRSRAHSVRPPPPWTRDRRHYTTQPVRRPV